MKSNFFTKDLVIGNEKLKAKDECLEFLAKNLKHKDYGKRSATILVKSASLSSVVFCFSLASVYSFLERLLFSFFFLFIVFLPNIIIVL